MPPEVAQRVAWAYNVTQGTASDLSVAWYPKGQFSRASAWEATQRFQDPWPDVWRKQHTENDASAK